MNELFQSLHFRKLFYLAALIVLALLFIIKYTVIPVIDRRESEPKRVLRHILDTLIALVITAMIIGGVVFWFYGND